MRLAGHIQPAGRLFETPVLDRNKRLMMIAVFFCFFWMGEKVRNKNVRNKFKKTKREVLRLKKNDFRTFSLKIISIK